MKFKEKYISHGLTLLSGGFAAVSILTSCANTETPYSKEMKHTTPKVEYMPDMYSSPSYETYSENSLFDDNMSARKPVEGTVARGFLPYPYPNSNEGYEAAGYDTVNPVLLTPKILEEGKDLYSKFCVHCHGKGGNADGSLVQNGKFPPPPSYSKGVSSGGGSMKDLPPGKMYHVITYGKNLMGAHASQLSSEERWKIIHYVQTLQNE